jgi:hypothetical protein
MDTYIAQIRSLKQRYTTELLARRNVVACGIGYKIREGVLTDQLSLVVSVTHKVDKSTLHREDLIPPQMDGIPTDVVELGVLRAFLTPRDRWRPVVPPGVSLGHYRISAGTFGCLVRRGNDLFLLSNNHVLADINKGRAGDPVLQPSPADGGTAGDVVAVLDEFVPLDFGTGESECELAGLLATGLNTLARLLGSKHRLEPIKQTPGVNRVDAALARPLHRGWSARRFSASASPRASARPLWAPVCRRAAGRPAILPGSSPKLTPRCGLTTTARRPFLRGN